MSKSKDIRDAQKQRTKEIIRLKAQGKGWTWIADILDMDKSNVRRTYIKFNQSKGDNLA